MIKILAGLNYGESFKNPIGSRIDYNPVIAIYLLIYHYEPYYGFHIRFQESNIGFKAELRLQG